MPDYKEMYLTLFRETSKAISALQRAQQQAEELFMSDETKSHITVIHTEHEEIKAKKEKTRLPRG